MTIKALELLACMSAQQISVIQADFSKKPTGVMALIADGTPDDVFRRLHIAMRDARARAGVVKTSRAALKR